MSAERSGSAVRELQFSRQSFGSDVSAERSGSAVRGAAVSEVELLHARATRDPRRECGAAVVSGTTISVESSGQPSVMKSHAQLPASHGVRWSGQALHLEVCERREVRQRRGSCSTRGWSVCSDVSAERSGSAVRELLCQKGRVPCSDVSAERSSVVRDSAETEVERPAAT